MSPMNSSRLKFLYPCLLLLVVVFGALAASGCANKEIKGTEVKAAEPPKPPPSVPMWLGSPSRNFYGTGPWSNEPLQVVWEFKTSSTSGRLHKDPWGGTSWPGQPSVDENHVFFPSADGNLYCLDVHDGS